jgi:hypothetical protein
MFFPHCSFQIPKPEPESQSQVLPIHMFDTSTQSFFGFPLIIQKPERE